MSTSFYGWFTAGINDEQTSASTTWSSEKISEELAKSNSAIPSPSLEDAGKTLVVSEDGTKYDLQIPEKEIDNNIISDNKTWSSKKISENLHNSFEAEGTIVTVEPLENSPLQVNVQIEPMQEGTGDPSPENVRPIQGWDTVNVVNFTGKNLIDFKSAIPYGDGTIEILENGVKWSGIYNFHIPVSFPLKKGETITASWVSNVGEGQMWRVAYTDKTSSPTQDNGKYIQPDSTKTVNEIIIYKNHNWEDRGENMIYENIQLEYGTQSTSYEPYSKSNTVTVSIGQTVYGGTLDVGSGVLTVEWIKSEIPNTSPSKILTGTASVDVGWNFPQKKFGLANVISQAFKTETLQSPVNSSIHYVCGRGENKYVTFGIPLQYVDDMVGAGNYIRALSPYIVYELNEPVTIQLIPQEILALSGVNTIYADAGSIQVQGLTNKEKYTKVEDKQSSLINTWSSETFIKRFCPPFETTGSVVTCNPVEASKLNALVQIEPIQEGTGDPSPENVRPIQGWDTVNVVNFTGKNLIDFKSTIPYGDGTIEILENGVKWSGMYFFEIPVSFPLKKGKAITASWVSNVGTGQAWRIRYTDNTTSPTLFNGKYIQPDSTKTVAEIMIYKNHNWEDRGENMIYENIQLEYGTQSTSYEPYSKSNTVTVSIGQTVYGGILDVGSGTLTVTKKHFTLTGTEPFALYQTTETINRFWHTAAGINGDQSKVRTICNYYPSFLSNTAATGNVGVYQTGSAINGAININLLAAEVPDIDAFNTLMKSRYDAGSPVEIVCELGTPLTVQLTPQEIFALSGENTVYADVGDVTVSGHSDPNAIINSLAERIAALESAATNL